MRWVLILWLIWPMAAFAQSKTVLPSELELSVSIDDADAMPVVREMVLITIRGVFRRHITREMLIQPDLEGFSWAQLGPDHWTDERIDGQQVKVFERRMAIYPDRTGTLTIGAFTHRLTLTDEGDDWFERDIQSEPVSLTVSEAPAHEGWWFPVRRLKIADDWSNAPDQLTPGEGVLRVVRIEALGVTPEMIPPMPDLKSPSAMIFPHPEKRLVELTAEGPVTYAFWRWTIRPSNDTSTIVEPLSLSFFDTINRDLREVTISAQRVAYGSATGPAPRAAEPKAGAPSRLPGWPVGLIAAVVLVVGIVVGLGGRSIICVQALHRFSVFDPLAWRMWRSARVQDLAAIRRASLDMMRRDGPSKERAALLGDLDQSVFDPHTITFNHKDYVAGFLKASTEN
ncbi:MAG: hypothetical protein ABJ251_08435 [Paracoccaceae bacterium]